MQIKKILLIALLVLSVPFAAAKIIISVERLPDMPPKKGQSEQQTQQKKTAPKKEEPKKDPVNHDDFMNFVQDTNRLKDKPRSAAGPAFKEELFLKGEDSLLNLYDPLVKDSASFDFSSARYGPAFARG